MKAIYADTENIRELLKDTEKEPVFIQGPDDLTGVLLPVETYELLGRYDDGMLGEREEADNDTGTRQTQ